MNNSAALEGVKVLDLTQIMAGPYCTMMLADMGADVVKVEKPNGGDDTRRMGPPFIEGESAAFLGINRNKRSIVVDLRSDEGREIVMEMAREYDVLVQNFRPGSLERMGLGYEQARELNPAMVYCTISGFGVTGPYARRGGFDLVTQGMSGLMSVTGHPDSAPTKVGVPVCDLNAGMFAAIGILTAYINRLKTGIGQHVDTSLLEGGIAYTFWESAMYFATGAVPGPKGQRAPADRSVPGVRDVGTGTSISARRTRRTGSGCARLSDARNWSRMPGSWNPGTGWTTWMN